MEKKNIMVIVCLMAMVLSVNAHNVHYPTYTEDGITYVKNGTTTYSSDGVYTTWDILKVDKPYDRTITIPYSVTINGEEVKIGAIRENAFSTCVSLDSLIISDGLYLYEETFIGCKELEYLYYTSNVSKWHPYYNKFSYYPNLSCKTLETVYGVWEDTFWKSISKTLETLIIHGNGVNTRMDYCKKLKNIICYSLTPPSSRGTKDVYTYSCSNGEVYFESYQWSTITLYVPRESLELYYFDTVWGEIDNILPFDEMNNETNFINVVSESVKTSNVWYSTNGIKVNTMTNGIYIKNGKKYMITKK